MDGRRRIDKDNKNENIAKIGKEHFIQKILIICIFWSLYNALLTKWNIVQLTLHQ